MNILFVNPDRPETFWDLKHVLKFISRKSIIPPLGLLTVAAMLPENWHCRLKDLVIEPLEDKDILWADYVFLGGMFIQKAAITRIARRCKDLGVPTVAGGPVFREDNNEIPEIDHIILGEAENIIDLLIEDIKNGNPRRTYQADHRPDLTGSPPPRWDLIDHRKYASMSIQSTRGCPFGCDFCDVTYLFGNKMRLKTTGQIITELDNLYDIGWKSSVFIVDDNFIGSKKFLKNQLLPAMIDWMKARAYPFVFNTQVSINIADDEELMTMMSQAGFDTVFIGIETSNDSALQECSKTQNRNRNLEECVHKIQRFGLQVQAGFILGFDSDRPSIFEKMASFIQSSGISTAMVGLLNVPRDTKLYHRLNEENRLLKESTGDNTDYSLGFIPKMDPAVLVQGYKSVVQTIYAPKNYYKTALTLLKNYKPPNRKTKLCMRDIKALFKSMLIIGILNKGRMYYWRLLIWSFFKCRKNFNIAVMQAIYGFHFRKVFAPEYKFPPGKRD